MICALVHGAWHGGWCWERLVPELEARGHTVVAPDLPCEDVAAGFEEYADVVVAALEDAGDDVVLVGHSLGGLTIPYVAKKRPVRRLVYLCALLHEPGLSFLDQLRRGDPMLHPDYGAGVQSDEQGRSAWVDEEVARRHFYADCAPDDAHAAFARLRPQAGAGYGVPFDGSFPPVPATYILTTEDEMVLPPWSRTAARERLGVEAIELPGSHSPFLSRPAALAEVLIGLAMEE